MTPIGIVNLSFAEFERSLSCHSEIFSWAIFEKERSILASEDILSLFIGFLFTGTALLPNWPFLKGSSTSPISVLCKFLISVAILSKVHPINEITN